MADFANGRQNGQDPGRRKGSERSLKAVVKARSVNVKLPLGYLKNGAPGETRTPDLLVRS